MSWGSWWWQTSHSVAADEQKKRGKRDKNIWRVCFVFFNECTFVEKLFWKISNINRFNFKITTGQNVLLQKAWSSFLVFMHLISKLVFTPISTRFWGRKVCYFWKCTCCKCEMTLKKYEEQWFCSLHLTWSVGKTSATTGALNLRSKGLTTSPSTIRMGTFL